MKYKGIELKEFTSDKPVAFDPPVEMLCWNVDVNVELTERHIKQIDMYLPAGYNSEFSRAITVNNNSWRHCAVMPERKTDVKRD